MFGVRLKLWPVLVGIFAVAAVINGLTPMVSDDYAYFLKGVSWHAIWGHYTGWSGRLVADTLSSSVLGLGVAWVADAINALALTLLVLFLSALGLRLAGQQGAPKPCVVLLVFALYWVSNPDLGQTTFWIVGSANYLWTNVFNFGFALAFVLLLKRNAYPKFWSVLLCLVAVVAGCTNENTGVVTGLLLAMLAWQNWRAGNRSVWPWVWLVCMAIGVAVLVLAPGNVVREGSFQRWYDQPYWWRVVDHFIRRFPDAMARYWEVFLVLLVMAYSAPVSLRVKRLVWLMVGMSCLANAILVFAPNIPKRALQGAFLYTLVAVSILAHSVMTQ